MNRATFALAAATAATALVLACGSDPPGSTGGSSSSGTDDCREEGCMCLDGSDCGPGLACASRICVEDGEGSSSSGGAGETSSSTDASSSSTGVADESTGSVTETPSTTDVTSSTGEPGPVCGDGLVEAPEQCDDGQETKLCDSDCTVAVCGDAETNAAAGEQCDDGNVNEEDACLSDCKLPACGDGKVQQGETCDDGNEVDGDGCDSDCTASWWEHEGVAYDVHVSKLKGWTLCWEYEGSESLPSALKKCEAGEHLLVGCADLDTPSTLIMAAHGLRAEIVKTGIVNGTNWVLGASAFAYAEPGVKIGEEGPELYWSMTNYTLDGLSKCEDFNKSGIYRRVMYQR